MMMPGREYQAKPSRFGFNGKENDNDEKGFGNQQDYGFRIYDPRVGKFLSVDPLVESFPFYTPYQYASNNPLIAVDLDGLESSNDKNPVLLSYQIRKGDTYTNMAKRSGGLLSVNDIKQLNPGVNPNKLIPGRLLNLGAMDLSDEDLRVLDLSLSNLVMQGPFEKKREMLNANEIKAEANAEFLASGLETRITSIEFQQSDVGVGAAEGVESLAPIWGSGRNAINDFQNGRYLKGTFNSAVAISDVFMVKSIGKDIAKGGLSAFGLGNSAWGSYRSHYLKSGFAKPGEPLHHWLLHKNGPIGKYFPNAIKNQMWNLKPFATQAEHTIYGHGNNFLGRPGANFLTQLWV